MVANAGTDSDNFSNAQIDVSTLGSHVFCRRAGILAFKKQGSNERVSTPRIPNLSYLPLLDERVLRERFDAVMKSLKPAGVLAAGGTLIVFLIYQFVSRSLGAYLSLAIFPAFYVVQRDARSLIEILAALSNLKRQEPTPLLRETESIQPVTWLGLLKAGYRSVEPKEAYRDEDLVLAGLPWRLLTTSDAQRIPIIRHVGGPLEVNDSHRARLAAYSRLIMKNEPSCLSNWGIVIDGSTLEGFAVRINHFDRDKVATQVSEIRETLEDHSFDIPIAEPNKRACLNCPFGSPEVYQIGFLDWFQGEKKQDIHLERTNDRRRVHCECGDEFKWRPPHSFWQNQ